MDVEYGTIGEMGVFGKLEGKRPHGKHRLRWEDPREMV
jgi:hypothetical protein